MEELFITRGERVLVEGFDITLMIGEPAKNPFYLDPSAADLVWPCTRGHACMQHAASSLVAVLVAHLAHSFFARSWRGVFCTMLGQRAMFCGHMDRTREG